MLAAIGLYAVMSYAVSQSTRELGLCMAMGARRSDLLRLVMKDGVILIVAGGLMGSAVALEVTRPIAAMLYKVDPRNPFAFGFAFGFAFVAASRPETE